MSSTGHQTELTQDPTQQVNLSPAPIHVPSSIEMLDPYFKDVSKFCVKQELELVEIIFGYETQNLYEVYDQTGQVVLKVGEKSHWLQRNLLISRRSFTLSLKNIMLDEIISMERSCYLGLFGIFWPDKMIVRAKDERKLGSISQRESVFTPSLTLLDASDRPIFKLKGPCWPCRTCSWVCICNDVNFSLLSYETGREVGRITKNWSGIMREAFTDQEMFEISFPQDLDSPMKAVCLATLFLIDFEYYESRQCKLCAGSCAKSFARPT